MGRAFATITDQMRSFVDEQHLFFVATAPSEGGNVNLSPKGYESFRILDDNRVCYLDLTGSGAETIAHVQENGRITFMFCAFTGKPNIVRFYGHGNIVRPGDEQWDELIQLFDDMPGIRSIIVADVHRTSTACGYAVPFMDYVEDRDRLKQHWTDKTPDDLDSYWEKKNATSIDGLPAVQR